jgi:hypothetical protein
MSSSIIPSMPSKSISGSGAAGFGAYYVSSGLDGATGAGAAMTGS